METSRFQNPLNGQSREHYMSLDLTTPLQVFQNPLTGSLVNQNNWAVASVFLVSEPVERAVS